MAQSYCATIPTLRVASQYIHCRRFWRSNVACAQTCVLVQGEQRRCTTARSIHAARCVGTRKPHSFARIRIQSRRATEKNSGSSALWRVTVGRISPYDSRGHSWRTPQIQTYRAQVGATYGARCVVMSSRGLWRFGYATRVHDIGNAMAGTGQAPPSVVIPCAAANRGFLLRNSARRCGSCRQARPRLACRAAARCLRPGHCHAARRRYGHWRDT